MFKRYSEKQVRSLVNKLKEEYDGVVRQGREAFDELKEENKELRARVSLLESERQDVVRALLDAEKAGDAIKKSREAEAENAYRELSLLSEQCRVLLSRLMKKYPDEDDVRDFSAFCDALNERLNGVGESGFDMGEVLAPKLPLDLESLCRDLGLMQEGEE